MSADLPAGQRVVVSQFGEDPASAIEQHCHLVEMPAPAAPGPREVLVAVCSAAVGWVDLLMTSGQYQHMPKPPYTPGLEYAGIVLARGAEVPASFAVGQRVIVDGFLAGPRSLGAYQAAGGFASYAVVPTEALLAIPANLDFDEACNLLGNYETAWHCLVARGRVQPGEWVLVHGASGATGLAAVEICRELGARVIATGRSEEKLQIVRERGAEHTILLQFDDHGLRSFRDEVKRLSGGAGVDVVYDGVGGDISPESLRCLRFGGRFLIVGWAATPNVARGKGLRGAPNANQLPTNLMMMKSLDVLGCPTILSTVENPASRAPRLDAILKLAAEGRIRPHVSHIFDLEDFRAAMHLKWRGGVTGGCVLRPWKSMEVLVKNTD